jgi:hypothetical protein
MTLDRKIGDADGLHATSNPLKQLGPQAPQFTLKPLSLIDKYIFPNLLLHQLVTSELAGPIAVMGIMRTEAATVV